MLIEAKEELSILRCWLRIFVLINTVVLLTSHMLLFGRFGIVLGCFNNRFIKLGEARHYDVGTIIDFANQRTHLDKNERIFANSTQK